MKEIKKLLLGENLYYFNNFINNNNNDINKRKYYAYNEKTKLDIHNTNYVNVRVRPKEYLVNNWINSKRFSGRRKLSKEKLIINKDMLYRIDISKNKER